MSDDERTSIDTKLAAIDAKLDTALKRMEEDRANWAGCRASCEKSKETVHGRITELKGEVDRIIGGKINPAWIYAGAMVIMAALAVMGLRGGVH